jgi:hypothetical protein
MELRPALELSSGTPITGSGRGSSGSEGGIVDAARNNAAVRLGRAFLPGRGAVFSALVIVALVVAGCGSSGLSSLPKSVLDPGVDATLVGTISRPALQTEGLGVEVETAHFDVLVTVSGPVVPGEGLPVQPSATTCTWTVKMTDATGEVPIALADFHSVDHLGSVFLMGLVPGEHPLPKVLLPHHSLTFELRAYELVGEGVMQWAPDHRHVLANWDYTVEND